MSRLFTWLCRIILFPYRPYIFEYRIWHIFPDCLFKESLLSRLRTRPPHRSFCHETCNRRCATHRRTLIARHVRCCVSALTNLCTWCQYFDNKISEESIRNLVEFNLWLSLYTSLNNQLCYGIVHLRYSNTRTRSRTHTWGILVLRLFVACWLWLAYWNGGVGESAPHDTTCCWYEKLSHVVLTRGFVLCGVSEKGYYFTRASRYS